MYGCEWRSPRTKASIDRHRLLSNLKRPYCARNTSSTGSASGIKRTVAHPSATTSNSCLFVAPPHNPTYRARVGPGANGPCLYLPTLWAPHPLAAREGGGDQRKSSVRGFTRDALAGCSRASGVHRCTLSLSLSRSLSVSLFLRGCFCSQAREHVGLTTWGCADLASKLCAMFTMLSRTSRSHCSDASCDSVVNGLARE
jgi:hypothetical protein